MGVVSATTILLGHPQGPEPPPDGAWGGSVITHFFFSIFFLIRFLEVLMWTSINFWTEVSSLPLSINEVPSTIRNKPRRTKNKVFKLQEGQTYLTKKKKKLLGEGVAAQCLAS
jgi:hypothetical protein